MPRSACSQAAFTCHRGRGDIENIRELHESFGRGFGNYCHGRRVDVGRLAGYLPHAAVRVISPYAWSLFIVIPVGAFFCGVASAGGYWLGAKMLNQRPGWLLFVAAGVLSVATYFFANFAAYASIVVNGVSLRSVVSFSTYLDQVLRHSQINLDIIERADVHAPSPELGGLGYLFAVIQISGFTAGGIAVLMRLKRLPYCQNCHRYLKREFLEERYSTGLRQVSPLFREANAHFKAGQTGSVLAAHSALGSPNLAPSTGAKTELSRWTCPICVSTLIRVTASEKKDQHWKRSPGLMAELYVVGTTRAIASTHACVWPSSFVD